LFNLLGRECHSGKPVTKNLGFLLINDIRVNGGDSGHVPSLACQATQQHRAAEPRAERLGAAAWSVKRDHRVPRGVIQRTANKFKFSRFSLKG